MTENKPLRRFGTRKRDCFFGQKNPITNANMAKNPPLVGHFPVCRNAVDQVDALGAAVKGMAASRQEPAIIPKMSAAFGVVRVTAWVGTTHALEEDAGEYAQQVAGTREEQLAGFRFQGAFRAEVA